MPTRLPFPKDIQKSEPEVFIIESLAVVDEINSRFEGRVLCENLKLLGSHPLYYYCRTASEIAKAVDLFCHSKYRWLHISVHGSPDAILTTLEIISNQEFREMCDGKLKNRRLVFSACEIGSGGLPTLLKATNQGMHSIASPMGRPTFGVANAFWNAFYTQALTCNRFGMQVSTLQPLLTQLCNFFSLRINWEWYDPHPKYKCWKQKIIG